MTLKISHRLTILHTEHPVRQTILRSKISGINYDVYAWICRVTIRVNPALSTGFVFGVNKARTADVVLATSFLATLALQIQ
jgi:hypothetical protein